MSYFTETAATAATQNPAPDASTEDYVTKVAELKGENWKNPNEIAKGYLSAQEHIKNIERENAVLKDAQDRRDYAAEVLSALEKRTPSGGESTQGNSTSTNTPNNQPGVSVEEIKGLIKETITNEEKQRSKADNLKVVDTELTKMFGTEVSTKVEAKRTELGMTKESMAAIAQESPSAFLALIGKPPSKEGNHVPSSSVNTAAGSFQPSSTDRTFKYYNELRRSDPKAYKAAMTRDEMFKDRERLGSAFYD